jgi:hypothetical protein
LTLIYTFLVRMVRQMTTPSNKSLQATRDSAFSLSRSRWLADVTSLACLSSGR